MKTVRGLAITGVHTLFLKNKEDSVEPVKKRYLSNEDAAQRLVVGDRAATSLGRPPHAFRACWTI
eukprot:1190292-Prorocentrum_minimum.AAC.10